MELRKNGSLKLNSKCSNAEVAGFWSNRGYYTSLMNSVTWLFWPRSTMINSHTTCLCLLYCGLIASSFLELSRLQVGYIFTSFEKWNHLHPSGCNGTALLKFPNSYFPPQTDSLLNMPFSGLFPMHKSWVTWFNYILTFNKKCKWTVENHICYSNFWANRSRKSSTLNCMIPALKTFFQSWESYSDHRYYWSLGKFTSPFTLWLPRRKCIGRSTSSFATFQMLLV